MEGHNVRGCGGKLVGWRHALSPSSASDRDVFDKQGGEVFEGFPDRGRHGEWRGGMAVRLRDAQHQTLRVLPSWRQ